MNVLICIIDIKHMILIFKDFTQLQKLKFNLFGFVIEKIEI